MGAMRNLLKRLARSKSGNAAMIVALGMPALIGGTGFAVDTAQWYMWKREMQFAVDQAAIAGAWARAKEDTESTFETRAKQEFDANIQQTDGFVTEPEVALANFSGGTANSVTVSASATKKLPFSSFLTGNATTIGAYAQASFEQGETFTSCLIAVDEDASGAITLGGSSVLTAGCGLAALSDSATSIVVNGNPTIDAGWILSRGGIDQWLKDNTDDTILENLAGLTDPFKDLSPPNPAESQINRTYSCASTPADYTADKSETTTISYSYKKGSNLNNASAYNYSNPRAGSSSTTTATGVSVTAATTTGTTTSTTSSGTKISGNGQSSIWEVKTTTVATTYSNIVKTGGAEAGTIVPGTYSGIKIKCNTTFQTGVYIIDGGDLDVTGQYEVTGSNVMFVLKNGAGIKIAGGADINLTAIQASDLVARGVDSETADKLAGMLIFEDRNSSGNTKNKINGNANTLLNGTIYLPKSGLDFAGTAGVSSQCLMIAAATINLTGNANMTSFCPADMEESTTVVSTEPAVKLVA